MLLKDFNKKADEYTAKASEITRQLIFAGIAIIWLFKVTTYEKEVFDGFLLFPLICLCVALVFDLLQYVVAGYVWKRFYTKNEVRIKSELHRNAEVKAPRKLSKHIYFCYGAKILFMVESYILMLLYLVHRLHWEF